MSNASRRRVRTDLKEAGGLVERLHGAVADGQVARVGVGDDDLQGGRVHVPQVDVGLFALAEAAHEHRPAGTRRRTISQHVNTVVTERGRELQDLTRIKIVFIKITDVISSCNNSRFA